MKKIISIISIFLFFNVGFSQVSTQLDEKNGFKDFQLGDAFSKWESNLSYIKKKDDLDSYYYLYTGNCCNKVFQYPVERIILLFKDNKLLSITIHTEKFQKDFSVTGKEITWRTDDFLNINSHFTALFGEPLTVKGDDKSGSVTFTWLGNNVILISKYLYFGSKNGDRQQIIIADMTVVDREIKDGF